MQFGLNYGVSNSRGKVPFHETKKIITKAAKLNVSLLDTANYYGSSERIIGRALLADKSKR